MVEFLGSLPTYSLCVLFTEDMVSNSADPTLFFLDRTEESLCFLVQNILSSPHLSDDERLLHVRRLVSGLNRLSRELEQAVERGEKTGFQLLGEHQALDVLQ